MRKIIVTTMVTLDGVMQAPGGPGEDTAGGFKYGGWTAPYGDEVSDEAMQNEMKQMDYLLGRNTFEIWEDYWPQHADFWPAISEGMKYVMSTTRDKTDWENTTFIKNVDDIKRVKNSEGADLQVWGSSKLVQTLLENDLIDELWLKIYPLTLGQGKKLFGEGTIPMAFTLTDTVVAPSGIIMAYYKRAGEVKTGTVGI